MKAGRIVGAVSGTQQTGRGHATCAHHETKQPFYTTLHYKMHSPVFQTLILYTRLQHEFSRLSNTHSLHYTTLQHAFSRLSNHTQIRMFPTSCFVLIRWAGGVGDSFTRCRVMLCDCWQNTESFWASKSLSLESKQLLLYWSSTIFNTQFT